MDESFAELAQILQFRDKEQERAKKAKDRKEGTLTKDEMEMDAWDKEMKVRHNFMFVSFGVRGLFCSSCSVR